MNIEVTRLGNAAIVRLDGHIADKDPELQLRATLQRLVEASEVNTVIDVERVDWVDSLALGVLVSHYISTSKRGGRVIFVNANDKIRDLMELARLEDCFGWSTSVDDALEQLEQA